MAKPYHKPPTPIDQAEIIPFPSLEARRLIQSVKDIPVSSQVAVAADRRIKILEGLYRTALEEALEGGVI